ncbi:JNK1/MAPK8-associated membrane protein [Brevipalpus obovatus]|uniref:JNK1/MAPK8-associated membrane protein n=1 Tax=Brevipalpus obovatus TaxID=246614 RepID=UPI003D9F6902
MSWKWDSSSAGCPGLYCGRIKLDNGSYSSCGPCPTGYRSETSYPYFPSIDDAVSLCLKCSASFDVHEWLYLGFMALVLLVIELYIIDYSIRRRNLPGEVLVLHLSALVEIVLASVFTLASFSTSFSSMKINFCGAHRLSDWYTLFFNPSINFKETIRCTQEAVYPLYSMIYLFYLTALVFLVIIRPWIVRYVPDKKAPNTIYLTLYAIPALAICHAMFSGLIYYSFPFITLIGSIISVACHFAFRLDQSMKALFLDSFANIRSTLIILGHWVLHAYGIISLTKFKNPSHILLLLIVPLPSLFYILTSKFTDPRAH